MKLLAIMSPLWTRRAQRAPISRVGILSGDGAFVYVVLTG